MSGWPLEVGCFVDDLAVLRGSNCVVWWLMALWQEVMPAQAASHTASEVYLGHDLHIQRQHPHRGGLAHRDALSQVLSSYSEGTADCACSMCLTWTDRGACMKACMSTNSMTRASGNGPEQLRCIRTGQSPQAAEELVWSAHDDAVSRHSSRRAQPPCLCHCRAGIAWPSLLLLPIQSIHMDPLSRSASLSFLNAFFQCNLAFSNAEI